ncbi:uncharacterized protein CXQ87_001864 [Candidozyma duobushaemuli]|uniref:Pre-rRNA-processing protein IPI3 n=2 Tax=Candidozyma TaxID=3303203 RepID=A0ABX8I419_9ASCO|nr:uncharacterized protein CXQ87_001864 [[Candida] duobushaemulonis]PVH13746.1 hypothetical protein CXQ87_001864 [[Candida] duobushaemulonis]QWU88021.1 hypothetical protein CA3LBN_002286 [[Candida] haemuloni]
MDEVAFYVTHGSPDDKHSKESLAAASSVHKSSTYASFRNADCPMNGAALTGMGPGERLFVAGKDKALISCYSWGKESVDQKFPVPENMSCLALAEHPEVRGANDGVVFNKPKQHIPWLLAAGSSTGKLYIWELASGNLLCVKDAHYQGISVIRFSKNSTFCFTGGLDSRVMVWRTADLVSFDEENAKPLATFSDHTLAITDIAVSDAPTPHDVKIYTSSKDSTVRLYSVVSKKMLSAFVFSSPVECIARDGADRAFYAGLSDGTIRMVPLYVVNKISNTLEAVGGSGKVITVAEDPEHRETFVFHQNGANHPTRLVTSLDGTSIISSDTAGQVFVSDVVTKQVIKAFTPCKSPIAYLHVETHSEALLKTHQSFDKKHRLLQPLKRVVFSGKPEDHVITMQIPGVVEEKQTVDEWFEELEEQEYYYREEMKDQEKSKEKSKNDDSAKVKELEEKLEKVSGAYNNLKGMYEDLYKETQK